jgi:hypothetical protein
MPRRRGVRKTDAAPFRRKVRGWSAPAARSRLPLDETRFEPHVGQIGHYWPFVPESAHIRVYIPAYPPRYRPVWGTTWFGFYLQFIGLGNWTVLTEALDRTQEVGGSNPPSDLSR